MNNKQPTKITKELLSSVMAELGRKSNAARKKKYGKDWLKPMLEARWKGHIKKEKQAKTK